MQVRVYKRIEGRAQVFVIPARRAHMAPLQVLGTDKEALKADLLLVLTAVDAAERPQQVAGL